MQHMTNRKQVRVRQRVGVLADGCATFMAKIYSGGVWSKALMSQWGGGVLGDVCRDLIIPMVGDVGNFAQPTKELPRGETTRPKTASRPTRPSGSLWFSVICAKQIMMPFAVRSVRNCRSGQRLHPVNPDSRHASEESRSSICPAQIRV